MLKQDQKQKLKEQTLDDTPRTKLMGTKLRPCLSEARGKANSNWYIIRKGGSWMVSSNKLRMYE